MSARLESLENQVQLAALAFLAVVYLVRLVWLFRFPVRRERTHAAGSAPSGITLSLLNVAMPWAMESVRRRPMFYLQFVVFHIGVTLAIATSFIIPYWPRWFESAFVVRFFQVLLAAAFLVGLARLYRRLTTPALRLVSTADDYLSLAFTVAFFLTAFFAVPNDWKHREWPLVLFFALTAVFLVYVPFSKICHYLYYPFTRFFFGRSAGHRGVFPKAGKSFRVVDPSS